MNGRGTRAHARWRSPDGRERQAGAVLVVVLVVALLLGLAALSLTFTVTLDNLAARHAQQAVLAEGEVEGALQLAASQIAGTDVDTRSSGPAVLGPWPAVGIDANVDTNANDGGVVSLLATSHVGQASVTRSLDVDWARNGAVLILSRP